VHQAARIRDQAVPGQVLASDTTRTLASTGFTYRSLGARELKGIPGPVELYAAEEDAPQTSIVFNPKLSLSDRFAIGMAKLMPGQTRMIQRITNRSYARLEG
jgi:hypothetical protein